MNNQTLHKLKALKLSGMAEAYSALVDDQLLHTLAIDEVLTILVDREENKRKDSKHERLLKQAGLEQPLAHMSDIDYSESRRLSRDVMHRLASCQFIGDSRNIVVMGATGSGKSYLACAIGRKACHLLYSVHFTRMHTLLEEMNMASELKLTKIKRHLMTCNLLIIDDWMLSAIDEKQTGYLYEIIHARELSDRTSTLLCTQYDLKGCAKRMAGQTMSDAIYDRLEHNAYVINLSENPDFPSMRERYGKRSKLI